MNKTDKAIEVLNGHSKGQKENILNNILSTGGFYKQVFISIEELDNEDIDTIKKTNEFKLWEEVAKKEGYHIRIDNDSLILERKA